MLESAATRNLSDLDNSVEIHRLSEADAAAPEAIIQHDDAARDAGFAGRLESPGSYGSTRGPVERIRGLGVDHFDVLRLALGRDVKAQGDPALKALPEGAPRVFGVFQLKGGEPGSALAVVRRDVVARIRRQPVVAAGRERLVAAQTS